jgi:hypothetical protein
MCTPKASTNFALLHTIVPMSIVRQRNLKEGDKLDWPWEVRNNEMVVVIRRVAPRFIIAYLLGSSNT